MDAVEWAQRLVASPVDAVLDALPRAVIAAPAVLTVDLTSSAHGTFASTSLRFPASWDDGHEHGDAFVEITRLSPETTQVEIALERPGAGRHGHCRTAVNALTGERRGHAQALADNLCMQLDGRCSGLPSLEQPAARNADRRLTRT